MNSFLVFRKYRNLTEFKAVILTIYKTKYLQFFLSIITNI